MTTEPHDAAAARADREAAFRIAEGSSAHEFGADFVPGDAYREARRKIIEGQLSTEQAVEELLSRYAMRGS